MYYKLL